MNSAKFASIFLCVFLSCVPAIQAAEAVPGYFLSGNDLYASCQRSRVEAQAYALGFNDGQSLRDETSKTRTICLPWNVKSGQVWMWFADICSRTLRTVIGKLRF